MAKKWEKGKLDFCEASVHEAMLDWMDGHVGRQPTLAESNELRKLLQYVYRHAAEHWDMFIGPGNVYALANHYRTAEVPPEKLSREEFEATCWSNKEEMLANLLRVKKE